MSTRRLVVTTAVIAAALAWVAAKGLSGNLVYYRTPAEVIAGGVGEDARPIRVGGLVEPGSVNEDGSLVRFTVSDSGARLPVETAEGVPSLFKAGRGVVVEGIYGRDGVFHADTVLVKHGSEYRPPGPGETPHSAELED
jgi:cytochrome c-type biogenesis protein CcmE